MLIRRRTVIIGGALAAAGCGNSATPSAVQADDVVLGSPTSSVILIEYFSLMCPVCMEFHQAVWAQLKQNYVDTNKIKMILREVPTHNGPVSVAEFQVARCGNSTPEQYVTRVGVMFDQRDAIEQLGDMAAVRQRLIEIGAAANLSEAQVMACITNEEGVRRNTRNVEIATRKYGDWGTPLLDLNGERLTASADYTYAGLSRRLDAALAR